MALVVAAVIYLVLFSAAISPGPGTDVEFDGQFEMVGDRFQMHGAIIPNPYSEPGIENISVYFYSEDGELLEKRGVGELNSRLNVSVRVETAPKYVIVDSPDFWSRSNIQTLYYYKAGMFDGQPNYQSKWASSKAEFPKFHRTSTKTSPNTGLLNPAALRTMDLTLARTGSKVAW
ncbi:hypothetical protein I7X12_05870 [Halosimplex litoreum]|uniref:Uncharacterized protein n=1 Tax=Halosimplex litoreum TaxID=1198301 RepID=A0A7T3G0J8_9EURY|nr:hypothetical protein [Halosimplex litoreum]QPV64150.1 hypothetical protein I7X12_05870 [Halosimplex litoreum]